MSVFDDLLGQYDSCAETWIPNVPIAVFMILIVIIGLFGNAIVFFVIIVLKEYKKSVSNWYILQLALADTLFLLMLPLKASSKLSGKWDFEQSLCKATEGIIFVNYYASIFFLTIMSFDRYMAVTKSGVSPWADVLRRIDSAALISLITWLISVCLCVPIFLYSKLNSCSICAFDFPRSDAEKCELADISPNNKTACEEYLERDEVADESISTALFNVTGEEVIALREAMQRFSTTNSSFICKDSSAHMYSTWLYVNFSVMMVLAFVLICIFYGLILRTMMGTAPTASTNQRRYRRRVTLMVLALVSLFAVSWIPWYAVQIAKIRGFYFSKDGCERLTDFTWILSYLNSALNPYFYSFMGSRFHQRFLRARSTATRKSRLFSYISRMSWHPGQDSNNSTSGGGTGKSSKCATDMKMRQVNGHSDDESFNTKTNIRTERTMVDPQEQSLKS